MWIRYAGRRPLSSGRGSVGFGSREPRRGGALLTVLWLSAALAAIAFSLSSTVRSEIDRTATSVDGLRAYYLATGAIQRCSIELLWSIGLPPDKRPIPQGSTRMLYHFPTGEAQVEIIPETAKLNVNSVAPEELYRLGVALGLEPERAQQIAAGIEQWRHPPEGAMQPGSPFLTAEGAPSFQPPRTSFQEIEELLEVQGVTPEVLYGTFVRNTEGRLEPRGGLADCLSVFGARDRVDANTAPPAVLVAVGVDPWAVSALLERRKAAPLTESQLNDLMASLGASRARLRVEGNTIVTMRATARLRVSNGQLSDLKRTVAALVKYMPPGYDSPIHILRWYDTAWSN